MLRSVPASTCCREGAEPSPWCHCVYILLENIQLVNKDDDEPASVCILKSCTCLSSVRAVV